MGDLVGFDFSWNMFFVVLLKLLVAFALTFPVAWQREKSTRIMGLRTFPIVAVACCGYVLVAIEVVGAAANPQARIIQGLMTGLGFLGGGAILKEGATVRGTATAASVWITGAVGGAVAYGQLELALLLSLITYLTLRLLSPFKEHTASSDARSGQEPKDKETP